MSWLVNSPRREQMKRLAELRQVLPDADLTSLKRRFETDRDSLSRNEVEFLWLATQERILEYEDEARRLGLVE
jgi:hypothetical protein